jgi:hypothetical protein
MIPRFLAAGLTVLALVYALFKRFTRPSLSKIRGPKSSSFVLGGSLSFMSARHIDNVVQETYSSYSNVRSVKPTLNGKASMGTSFASRPSLGQVQSTTSIVLVSNYVS